VVERLWGGWNNIFENTTSFGTIESSRCYTPKLNEANNVYFAENGKSLTAFVCLRMRTVEATDVILGWKRSRKNIELKTGSIIVANVVLCSLKYIMQVAGCLTPCRYVNVNKIFMINIFEVLFQKNMTVYEDKTC